MPIRRSSFSYGSTGSHSPSSPAGMPNLSPPSVLAETREGKGHKNEPESDDDFFEQIRGGSGMGSTTATTESTTWQTPSASAPTTSESTSFFADWSAEWNSSETTPVTGDDTFGDFTSGGNTDASFVVDWPSQTDPVGIVFPAPSSSQPAELPFIADPNRLTVRAPGSFTSFWASASADEKARFEKKVREVGVHFSGTSDGEPLFTQSVANCLITALHDPARKKGALAHFNIVQSGFAPPRAYQTVDEEIARMLEEIGSVPGGTRLLMWRGSGFSYPENPYIQSGGYAEHVRTKTPPHGFNEARDETDTERPHKTSTALLLDPVAGVAYELSRPEIDLATSLKDEAFRDTVMADRPAPSSPPPRRRKDSDDDDLMW